jgi:hypothetical protein
MPITRSIWTDDDGSGTTGTVLNNAELQKIYNNIDAYVPGVWQSPVFNAADYSGAASMTWTVSAGHVSVNRYTVIGKTLFWNVYIAGGTIGGTPYSRLLVKLPAGLAGRATNSGTAATSQLYDGVHQPGFTTINPDLIHLEIAKITEANFSVGVSYIRFAVVVELL